MTIILICKCVSSKFSSLNISLIDLFIYAKYGNKLINKIKKVS